MAIPKFKYVVLPFLNLLSDNKEHTMRDVAGSLSSQFKLNESELAESTPGGKKSVFNSRLEWVKASLKRAGLIYIPKPGAFRITGEGHKILSQTPEGPYRP